LVVPHKNPSVEGFFVFIECKIKLMFNGIGLSFKVLG